MYVNEVTQLLGGDVELVGVDDVIDVERVSWLLLISDHSLSLATM